MTEQENFESWYCQQSRDQISTWHPNEQRYTVFSAKQSAWVVWLAKSAEMNIEKIQLRSELAELKLELKGIQEAKSTLAHVLGCSQDARWKHIIVETTRLFEFKENHTNEVLE